MSRLAFTVEREYFTDVSFEVTCQVSMGQSWRDKFLYITFPSSYIRTDHYYYYYCCFQSQLEMKGSLKWQRWMQTPTGQSRAELHQYHTSCMNVVGLTHCFVIRRLCPGLLVDLPADRLRKNWHTVIRGKVCMCSARTWQLHKHGTSAWCSIHGLATVSCEIFKYPFT